ncbi:uncharacterized protein FIBRA_02873 [Fibroporia radiculosa]|uniref:Uncharacterized protein n=1 Tax=Fibroporia radiculosa TaxID=599839 RepID=J4I9A7_9APHY|nr:uncharacterized protein FIBRA_02873 [Fibroporia radiculosa]CCM00831.1 predicted protein [Fibroporia radiculosa]
MAPPRGATLRADLLLREMLYHVSPSHREEADETYVCRGAAYIPNLAGAASRVCAQCFDAALTRVLFGDSLRLPILPFQVLPTSLTLDKEKPSSFTCDNLLLPETVACTGYGPLHVLSAPGCDREWPRLQFCARKARRLVYSQIPIRAGRGPSSPPIVSSFRTLGSLSSPLVYRVCYFRDAREVRRLGPSLFVAARLPNRVRIGSSVYSHCARGRVLPAIVSVSYFGIIECKSILYNHLLTETATVSLPLFAPTYCKHAHQVYVDFNIWAASVIG